MRPPFPKKMDNMTRKREECSLSTCVNRHPANVGLEAGKLFGMEIHSSMGWSLLQSSEQGVKQSGSGAAVAVDGFDLGNRNFHLSWAWPKKIGENVWNERTKKELGWMLPSAYLVTKF